jgi:hypothetical protein
LTSLALIEMASFFLFQKKDIMESRKQLLKTIL